MRRGTAWALGGVLAGTLVVGVDGTTATFVDTAVLPAEAGAGSVTLDVTPEGPVAGHRLLVDPGQGGTVRVATDVSGAVPAELRLSVVGVPEERPCAGLPDITLTVRPATGTPTVADLCELATGRGVPLLLTGAPDSETTLSLTATGGGGSSPAADRWDGTLRLTLEHRGGGFSDARSVPVRVVRPDAQGGHGGGAEPGRAGGD
ncbi:hypothetical protein [Geodermatophilus sp. SYSU D00710]